MASRSYSNREAIISQKSETRIADADDRSLRIWTIFHEECGVFGVYGHPDAAALTALGLHALQHRGQEAAGIVAYDGEQFSAHRGLGQVSDNFSSKEVIGAAARQRRDRPCPLCDDRRGRAAQHAAAVRRFRVRRARDLPQRQSDQLLSAAPPAGAPRQPVPIDQRHRGHRPSDRDEPQGDRRRSADRRVAAGPGRLFAGGAVAGRDHRGARPARGAAAGSRPARRRLDPRLGDLRARHHRRRVRARHRSRRDRHHRRRRGAQRAAVRPSRQPVLRLRAHLFRPPRQRR